MDALAILLAIEEIKQLKARYFRCLDTKDWDGLSEIFCKDAIFDARAAYESDAGTTEASVSNNWLISGGDAIVHFISSNTHKGRITLHHGHGHEIEVISLEEARGVIAMEDNNVTLENGAIISSLHGWGHYHETYHKVDGQWKILSSRISRLRVEAIP